MTSVPSQRQERRTLALELRAQHKTWVEIADVFATRYDINKRVAFRFAHDWSQSQAADAWNERWPSDPKTFKNFSYWEQWPASTGYAPSLEVLARLAELYHCAVPDLLTDCQDFRPADPAHQARTQLALLGTDLSDSALPGSEDTKGASVSPLVASKFLSSLEGMSIEDLAEIIRSWISQLDQTTLRQDLLLRLSAALSLAASRSSVHLDQRAMSNEPEAHDLAGIWRSQYKYYSSGRNDEFVGEHRIAIRRHGDRLTCRSLSKPDESRLKLNLSIMGAIATGTWTERTSLTGYYSGATYHGTLQLVVNPMGRTMNGRWLGFDKEFKVNTGEWNLSWLEPSKTTRL